MRTLVVLASLALIGCAREKEETRLGTVPACDPASFTIETGPLPAPTGGTEGAVRTGRMGVGTDGSCHHFALPLLAADGARLSAPALSAGDFRRSYGIVRFDLPKSIAAIDQADSAFRDSTIAAAYVVHALDGGYFLDVHLAAPARASAMPAQGVGLGLAVGGGAIPAPAPRARNVVVLEPRNGGVTYPIVIKGYARTFEANVQGWIEQGDSVVAASKSFTTAADWSGTWGEFELTIPRGPGGDIVLFVGEESAKDGTPIGVRIPLRAAAGGR